MFFRHSTDKLIYPVIAVGVLLIFCYRPTYHLRSEMPVAFFSPSRSSAQKSSLEQKIAWGYWESAQMDIQWKYPHGHPLPADPPPEFHVSAQALAPVASDPATRQFYWRRLQEVWYLPESWTREYEWNFGWSSDPLTSGGQWLKERADRWFTAQ
jgi:hypothetical protein